LADFGRHGRGRVLVQKGGIKYQYHDLPEFLKLSFLKKDKRTIDNRYQIGRRFDPLANQPEAPTQNPRLQIDPSDSQLIAKSSS
jgi:hypothetical protein